MKKQAGSLKEWLIWQLRRLSYKWPPRGKALYEARRSFQEFKRQPGVKPASVSKRIRSFYECAKCGRVFPRRMVSVDHITPVVDPRTGWTSFEDYLQRLFCSQKGFQILCERDHDNKTKSEGKIRTQTRREKKR